MTIKKQPHLVRAPLTDKELESLTADDFVRLKLSDEEKARLRELNKSRQQERAQRSARLKLEEEPILLDLQRAGYNVTSVWDFVNMPTVYSGAIPILLKHLLLPYFDRTREGIARSLAVADPEVQRAWPILVDQYCRAPIGFGVIAPGDTKEYRLGAKDGLACALSAAVTDETLSELIDIARERIHGESRVLLLAALRRSKSPLAKRALKDFAGDPDLAKEIISWRDK
ncbi:hypothetical protein [Hydrogenophaga sp.]|uniref:hypothetical protein n=1 Tax=Hydrogenophaga sp. TaxID=1904254 RepID=UPI0035B34C21